MEERRRRGEQARRRREQEWAKAVASAQRTMAELNAGLQQLVQARGHEAIEAATDQLDACLTAARPLPIAAAQWEGVFSAGRRLVTALRDGEIAVQPQMDDLSDELRKLRTAIETRR